MKTLIYDCEIIKCIPNGARFSGFEYCDGWDDYENMGVSVIGYHWEGNLHHCLPPNWGNLPVIVSEADRIVGFNSKSFDDNLLRANGINIKTNFDLLEEIRIAAYGSPRWEDTPKGHSYSLGKIGSANGFPKNGSGELAPQLWQQGRKDEVIEYCLNDVAITQKLYNLFLLGTLKDPNTGKLLKYLG